MAAHCTLTGKRLDVEGLQALQDFIGFENLLRESGPWIAGLDFPFGLPRKFLENDGWNGAWCEYVAKVAELGKVEFEARLTAYKKHREFGDKEHQRRTDKAPRARSPMKLFYPPVGKMFFQGATRLLSSGACVLPCRPNSSERIVVEAYPAVVAQRLIKLRSYKNDQKNKQTGDQAEARKEIISGFDCDVFRETYGIKVEISKSMNLELAGDASGDSLDAVLAAIQAASSFVINGDSFGIPRDVDAGEGWIVDPGLKSS